MRAQLSLRVAILDVSPQANPMACFMASSIAGVMPNLLVSSSSPWRTADAYPHVIYQRAKTKCIIYLFIYLFICLFIYLFIYLFVVLA